MLSPNRFRHILQIGITAASLFIPIVHATTLPNRNQNFITPSKEIKWQADTSGVASAILHAYDKRSGEPYMRLFKAVKGFVNFPHIHRTSTLLYVAEGQLHIGFGAKYNKNNTITVSAGGFVKIPKNQPHYEWFDGPTLMVSSGLGDRATFYVCPNGKISKLQKNVEHQ